MFIFIFSKKRFRKKVHTCLKNKCTGTGNGNGNGNGMEMEMEMEIEIELIFFDKSNYQYSKDATGEGEFSEYCG